MGLAKVNTEAKATATHFGRIDDASKKTHHRLRAVGRTAALVGGAGGFAVLAVGVKRSFDEFQEAERATKQTRAVIKSTGGVAKVTAKHVEELANSISLKSGVDDEAIQSGETLLLTFKNIRNEVGKGNKVFDRTTQAAVDMSARFDQGLKQSVIQLGKALNDPILGLTSLQRIGVTFTQKQKDQIKTLEEHNKHLQAQKIILKEVESQTKGAAAAQATGTDKLRTAIANVEESFGKMFGPAVERASTKVATFINQMQSGEGAGGRFAQKLTDIWNAAKPVVVWFGRATAKIVEFAAKHPGITKVATAVGLVALAFNKFHIGTAIKAVAAFTKAAIATPGKVRDALSGVKSIFTRVFSSAGTAGGTTAAERAAQGIMGGGGFPSKEGKIKGKVNPVMRSIGRAGGIAMTAGVLLGLAGLSAGIGGILHKAKTDVIDPWVKRHFGKAGSVYSDIRDFIGSNLPDAVPGAPLLKQIFGKGIGDGMGHMLEGFPLGGAGGGDLMGANQNLAPFAALGRLYGLSVTSGLRPGAITSSGNLSLHATGNAIDVNAGAPFQMMAYANAMKKMYGSKLKELIYTPMGIGIKNGRPVDIKSFYGPQVASDHFDHVHVAMQRGGMAVPGHGSGDKVPVSAMVEPGERMFVLNRNAVPFFDAINGMFPRFQSGGMLRAAKAGRNAGFKGKALQYLLAIGAAESGDYHSMIGDLAYGGSYGPWQIHHPSHPQYNIDRLQTDWTYAAKAAYAISGGGSNWSPWTMFRNGGYAKWMGQASSAIAKTARKVKKKATPKKHRPGSSPRTTHPGRVDPSDVLAGFFGPLQETFAMRRALAELTPTLMDDIGVAQDAVSVWGPWLDVAKRNKSVSGITTAAQELKAAQDWLAELTGASTTVVTPDASEALALTQALLQQSNLRYGVSQAQYGVFAGTPGPGYQSGGAVPSVHSNVNVNVSDGMGWLRQFIRTEVNSETRRMAKGGPLPGRGGGLIR